MGVILVPFGTWESDATAALPYGGASAAFDPSSFGGGGVTSVKNLIPLRRGYRPIRTWDSSGGDYVPGYATSLYYHPTTLTAATGPLTYSYYDWSQIGFAGSPGDLWQLNGGSATNCSRAATTGTYLTEAGTAGLEPRPWYFHSWGDKVLATNYACKVQTQTTRGADFVDTITSAAKPKARLITSLGQHVILANIFIPTGGSGGTGLTANRAYPQMVWWSKTDDEASYSDPTTDPSWNSDYQTLTEIAGPITGVARIADDYAVIFKPRGCHIMQRTGESDIFSFRVLHTGPNAGTAYPASVVVDGRDIYYVNEAGIPCRMRDLGTPEPLTRLSIDQHIGFVIDSATRSGVASTHLLDRFVGVVHDRERYVMWVAPYTQDITDALIYNIDTGAVSVAPNVGNNSVWVAANGSQGIYGIQDLVTTSLVVSIDVYPGQSNTSEPWSLKTNRFHLNPNEGTLMTGSGANAITRVRLIYTSPAEQVSLPSSKLPVITVYSADDPVMLDARATVLVTTNGSDSHGWMTVPDNGKIVGEYFWIKVASAATGTNFITGLFGVQVESVPAGDR